MYKMTLAPEFALKLTGSSATPLKTLDGIIDAGSVAAFVHGVALMEDFGGKDGSASGGQNVHGSDDTRYPFCLGHCLAAVE